MEKFNVLCPDHYPMKCNLSRADKDYLLSPEIFKGFFISQYNDQDKWLEPTLVHYFSERTWRLYNAGKEKGTGTKFCNVCRYALSSDFGIVSLTPLNFNVFQEIGLMQGLQKPLIYLLNPSQKKDLPFDMADQIYIEHTDEISLKKALDNKIPLLLEKVRLSSGFENEQKKLIKEKISSLSPKAKDFLKRIILAGDLKLRIDGKDNFHVWAKREGFDYKLMNELMIKGFIVDDTISGGTRTLTYRKINDPYRKHLEELMWE